VIRGLPILAAVVAGVIVLAVLLRARRPTAAQLANLVLMTQGPARCLQAIRVLRHLAYRGSTVELEMAWERIELALVQAIPDCPPDQKAALRDALEACSQACRRRDISRRMMDVRNSL
jgi:hypothetical protein